MESFSQGRFSWETNAQGASLSLSTVELCVHPGVQPWGRGRATRKES